MKGVCNDWDGEDVAYEGYNGYVLDGVECLVGVGLDEWRVFWCVNLEPTAECVAQGAYSYDSRE